MTRLESNWSGVDAADAGADSGSLSADLLAVFSAVPGVALLLAADSPKFTMLATSDERLAATMTTRAETIGRPLFEVFPDANPDNPEASGVGNLRNSLETVLRTGVAHRMPVQRYDLRRPDGTWEERHWQPVNVPVRGADGGVTFLLHHVQDVTDQVVRAEALRRSEQGAARILEHMADAHFVMDRAFRFITVNRAALRMTGRPSEDLIGRTHWEVFPASLEMDVATAYRRVVAERVEQHLQQHYLGDGYDLHLEIDAYPTEDGGVAVFARDVGEKVRAIQARRDNEAQQYLGILGDSLRSLGDVETIQTEAARLLAEQLGASRVVYGETADDDEDVVIIHHDHRREDIPSLVGRRRYDAYGPAVAEALRTRRTVVVNDVDSAPEHHGSDPSHLREAGTGAYMAVTLVKEQRISAYMAVHQTAPRIWSVDDLALLEETAERTWAAVQRARAEAALRDADRRKDEFLATLAHELRNPLAPVRNSLQILRLSQPGSLAASNAMAIMERQVRHMVRLIDDLLDVSRISLGKLELHTERVALQDVLESAIEGVQPFIDAARHTMTLQQPAEPLYVDADVTRFGQVIGNLLHNAAKYTPDGGAIDIRVQQDGNSAVISIEDSGVGISPESLPHVFELFTQAAGSSLERSQGGLGIGLSIARRLVEMHGGSVDAASAGPGRGALFRVQLPLASPPSACADHSEGESSRSGESSTRRILVVDDSADVADSLAGMLTLWGHEIRAAYGGSEGLALAKDFEPSVVFCDIGMPGMNGYEVAKRLRTDERLANTFLVAVTGWGAEEDRQKALEAGFDVHLSKPVEPDAVQALLQAVPQRPPPRD